MKWFLRIIAIVFALFVIALLVFRVEDTDPAEMRAKYGAAPSQFVEMEDGLTVHYRDEGPRDAPALVLLHGSNADLHTWQEWTDRLADEYRIIRFDQIGHGLTGPAIDDDYTVTRFVENVDEMADLLGLETFVLGGNSMGGNIAMAYAIEHQDRLDGLILVDASGAPIERESGGNLAFSIAQLPVVGALMSSVLPRSLVERSYRQSVSNQDIVTTDAVDRYWELARYPGNRGATMKRFATARIPFTAQAVATVDVPTMVMWGEEDSLVPYAAAAWFMEHLPKGQLVNYPGIGHIPMEETPERSASDVRSFLVSLNSPAE